MLAENVEDEEHNTTRFVILSREEKHARPSNGPVVTTFVFRVRNLPAALYKAMGGFATNGVNMTKLESYMIEGNFFATMFYADVEGHPDDPPLARRAGGARSSSRSELAAILGVYPAQQVSLDLQGSRRIDDPPRPRSPMSRASRACTCRPGARAIAD